MTYCIRIRPFKTLYKPWQPSCFSHFVMRSRICSIHRAVFQHYRSIQILAASLSILWLGPRDSLRANQSATLQWTANTATNVAGYALYIGTNSGNYESRIDVGTNIMATVSGLTNGMTFYFVTTAYDSADVESTPSNEAQFASPTNNPPALGSITNFNMPALGTLLITNTASDAIKSDKL